MPFRYLPKPNQSIYSTLPTYNNAKSPCIYHSNIVFYMLIHNVKSTIPCLFILIQLISLPPQTCKRSFKLISSDTTFAHLFVLIIFEPISHIYATHATQTSYFIPKTF